MKPFVMVPESTVSCTTDLIASDCRLTVCAASLRSVMAPPTSTVTLARFVGFAAAIASVPPALTVTGLAVRPAVLDTRSVPPLMFVGPV